MALEINVTHLDDDEIRNILALAEETMPVVLKKHYEQNIFKATIKSKKEIMENRHAYESVTDIVSKAEFWVQSDNPVNEDFMHSLNTVVNANNTMKTIKFISTRESDDELLEIILNGCGDALHLSIHCQASPEFQFDPTNKPSFTCDSLKVFKPDWITSDHFMNLFMECKRFYLIGGLNISNWSWREIFQKWINGSQLEKLVAPYAGTNLAEVFGGFEGAVPLKAAMFGKMNVKCKFREGTAYLLTQKSGKSGIVLVHCNLLALITDYGLADENDESILYMDMYPKILIEMELEEGDEEDYEVDNYNYEEQVEENQGDDEEDYFDDGEDEVGNDEEYDEADLYDPDEDKENISPGRF